MKNFIKIISKSLFLFLILLSSIPEFTFASSDNWVEWSHAYGDEGNEIAGSLVNTPDGGYAIAGTKQSLIDGYSDFWLLKTNEFGNEEWNQTYGGQEHDEAFAMISTLDGGFALAGTTSSYRSFSEGLRDFWLVKTDSLGNLEWNQSYGNQDAERAYDLVQTSDEGFALAGYRHYSDVGNEALIVKTDTHGNLEWEKTFIGLGTSTIAYSIIETSDSGLAIACTPENKGEAIDYIQLIKTDNLGNVQWDFQTQGADGDLCRDVVETSDGGFLLAGKIKSLETGEHELGVIKLDSKGKQLWNKTLGDGFPNSIIITHEGGVAISGFTKSGFGNEDFLLVKTDKFGNEQWRRFYGTSEHERAYSVIETPNGFAIAGYQKIWKPNDSNFWLVKVNIQGIPEFTSWTVLPSIGTLLLLIAVFRKKYTKTRKHNFR